MLEDLNEAQKLAVKTIDGPVMVMAGAGSGKTKVLTERIAYIISNGISPYNILAVTFTNKAANEMKQRIAGIVDVETKYMWISTFHSFCSRLLRLEVDNYLPPYNKNFTILDEEDSLKIIKDILKKHDIEDYKPKKFKELISKSKNISNFYIKDSYLKRLFTTINSEYSDYLLNNNMMDFDDLMLKTIELLRKNPIVLEKYQDKFQYILVDEFQDTNDIQYKLMYMLASRYQNIFVVGDDFQSIYSFRGAKIENINLFRNDFPAHKLILLEENYRSSSQILQLANTIIEHNPNQIKKEMFSKRKEGQMPFYYKATSDKAEAMFVLDKIKKFHLSGDKYSDFAIMYRTNYISRIFEDMLIKYQIPYKIYGDLSFFSRKEIKDMVAYLRLIVNQNDDFSFNRIVNVPKRKIGNTALEKLNSCALENNCSLFEAINTIEGNTQGIKALKEFYKLIISIKEQINNIPLNKIIDVLLNETGYKDMLAIDDTEHARLSNIYEFKNVLKETDETVNGDNFDKLSSLLNDLSLQTDSTDDNNSDAVILTTYHQAKGLEFKNVFMVAMEEGVFPSEYHLDDLDIEEERRICYVGVTRAKDRLYISSADVRALYGRHEYENPSRFIKEMGNEHLKNISDNFTKKVYDIKQDKKSPSLQKVNEKQEFYSVGDKIEHNAFGRGIIVEVKEDNFIKVAFSSPTGIKVLLKNHPSYKKI